MGFRIVMIEQGEQLKSKLDNLYIKRGNEEYTIPLSDVSMLVVDSLKTIVTTRLMYELTQYNICLVICDKKHQPVGIYTGLNTHSRSSKILKKQLNWNDEFKNSIWKDIIKSKITNQKQVLEIFQKDKKSINLLENYIRNIELGDETNREGHAAKVYFNSLFGKDFTRDDENITNSCLNYIYAITRSFLARLTVAYGLTGLVGVHHKSEYNNFNLVDDLMEPFRPICDMYTVNLLQEIKLFDIDTRIKLLDFLNYKIKYKNKSMMICSIMEIYIQNFIRYSDKQKDNKIIFPEVRG